MAKSVLLSGHCHACLRMVATQTLRIVLPLSFLIVDVRQGRQPTRRRPLYVLRRREALRLLAPGRAPVLHADAG
jgi:hypothetical protein